MPTIPHLAIFAALSGAAATLSAMEYVVDDDHSFALFRVQHMNAGYTWGRFDDIGGELRYDPKDPSGNRVRVVIKAASLSTGVPKMEEHLRSNDFFDVRQFPELTFVSRSFARTGEGQYQVTGDLTICGRTRTITVPVTRTGMSTHAFNRKPVIGFETVFEINRRDFGITYGSPEVIGDTVRVTFALEALAK
ncbi:MAG: YceI family protein [Planctomycetota bacterium]|nr:YceI family protein [Planctomycetota bacterium]MCX8038988.1 YceI family protein [Planctomycetota bacterium]MDW8372761.1 YceI family protein [Planctomycetota bacterium]